MDRMSVEPTMFPAAFRLAFRAFLEQAVREEKKPRTRPSGARLTDHLDVDPRESPILAEEFSAIEHPNVQATLDAWVSGEARSAVLVGMSAEQKRYQRLGFYDQGRRRRCSRRTRKRAVSAGSSHLDHRHAGARTLVENCLRPLFVRDRSRSLSADRLA